MSDSVLVEFLAEIRLASDHARICTVPHKSALHRLSAVTRFGSPSGDDATGYPRLEPVRNIDERIKQSGLFQGGDGGFMPRRSSIFFEDSELASRTRAYMTDKSLHFAAHAIVEHCPTHVDSRVSTVWGG